MSDDEGDLGEQSDAPAEQRGAPAGGEEIWPNKNHKKHLTLQKRRCVEYIIQWIPTVALRTELVDSHSRSGDRIDGFPQ